MINIKLGERLLPRCKIFGSCDALVTILVIAIEPLLLTISVGRWRLGQGWCL